MRPLQQVNLPANQSSSPLNLPDDLEETALARFDDLVSKGEVLWKPSEAEVYDDHGFQVCTLDLLNFW